MSRRWLLEGLVGPLVHAGDAVVPAESVLIEECPENAEAERRKREEGGKDAAAHGRASRVFVGEGAEADAGIAHAGRAVRKGEEEELVEDSEYGQGAARARDGDGARDLKDGALSGEVGESEREGGGEGYLNGEDEADVDDGSHEAKADRRCLRDDVWKVAGVLSFREVGGGESGEEDGGPLRRDCLHGVNGGELSGLDFEDAELRDRGWIVRAQRALFEPGPSFASGDELAGKLDEIGSDGLADEGFFEDGVVAEGDLVVEREPLVLVELAAEVGSAPPHVSGRRGALCRYQVVDVSKGPYCEALWPLRGVGRGRRRGVGADLQGGGLGGRRVGVEECGVVERRERNVGNGDRTGRSVAGRIPVVEVGQELLLGYGYGVGVDGGDACGGVGLMDGALGFRGEKGTVALRVGVALGNGGGDAG